MVKRIIWLLAIVLGMVFVGAGDAEDWPQFRKDSRHTAETDQVFQPPLTVDWTFEAGDKIVSSPVAAGNQIYFGARNNNLYALNAADGTVLWTYAAGDWVDSTPAVTDQAIYVTSKDGYLHAVNRADGTRLWRYHTTGTDSASPVFDDGVVFAASGFPNKYIYAVNALDGSLVWKKETKQMVYSSPALVGDRLFIGSNDGFMYCLDKRSGKELWSFKTGGGMFYASPVIVDQRLFFAPGDFDWKSYALKITDGALIWEHSVEDAQMSPTYVSSMAAGAEHVFFVSGYDQQYLYALNSSNGSMVWKAPLGSSTRYGFSSSPVLARHTVYVATSQGVLKAFDRVTGTQAWEHDLGGEVLSSVTFTGDRLYAATLEGKLYSFK